MYNLQYETSGLIVDIKQFLKKGKLSQYAIIKITERLANAYRQGCLDAAKEESVRIEVIKILNDPELKTEFVNELFNMMRERKL